MSKTWTILISLALLLLILMTAYDLLRSISGQTITRRYEITQIESDLGSQTLDFLKEKEDNIYIKNENI